MRNPFIAMALMSAAMANFVPAYARRLERIERAQKATKDATYYKPNGPRECARRVRQIAKGMIQVSA